MIDRPSPAAPFRRPHAHGWVVGVIVLLVGLATWWFLQAEMPRGSVVEITSAPTSSVEDQRLPAELDLGGDARRGALSDQAFGLAGGIQIPAGVRLPGPGRLEGRALDRTSGSPLAGVRIDLLPLPPAGSQVFGRLLRLANTGDDMDKRVEAIAITGTDATGTFRFEGVRAGQYFLEARGTRHVPDAVAHARVLASGAGGPIDVYLREGGRVLGLLENPDGSIAAGAQVALTAGPTFAIEAARTGDILYMETRSDGEGRFVFCGVPPGDDWQATASGGAFALTHLPDIRVRAGEDTEVVLRTLRGGQIAGRILSAKGVGETDDRESAAPLAGAHVGAVPRGLRDLSYAGEILHATHAVTDASGRYTLHHVPAGEVDVLAIAAGHVPAKGPRVILPVGGMQVAPDFELPRGPMVSGRVVDSAGGPIEGVVVRWNAVDLRNFNFDFSFAPLLAQAVEGFEFPKTDADGRFLAGAFPGDPPHRIDFTRIGYRNTHVDWDPAKESELSVTLVQGGAVEGIVMDVVKQAPVTGFQISGLDRIDSEPTAPGRRNPFAGGQLVEDPQGRFRVESVAPGRRSLTFRAPGYLPKTVGDLEVIEGESLRGVIVELTPGGVVRGLVRNQQGAPVAGAQVFANAGKRFRGERRRGSFDNRTGRTGDPEDVPAGTSGFMAQLGMLGDRAVLSRADGTFELTGLAEGEVTLFASHRDYVLARAEPIQLAAESEPPQVTIQMSAGSEIFGRATDRFDRPIQGAIVLALSPANIAGQGNSTGGGLHQGNTDAEGRYSIEHVSAGGYFVVLTRGDQALNPLSFLGTLNFDLVTVPPEERVQFDIVDTSSGACRVSGVVTAAGQRLASGSIAALGFESESLLGVDFKLAQIRDDGTYEFAGLAPGEYTFQITELVRGSRPDQIQVTVEIPDLPEVRIDVALPQAGIEGVVLAREGGQPLEGCELVLTALDAPIPSGLLGQMMSRENGAARTRTNARGEFRFDRLQAGEYRLAVRPPRRGAGQAHFAQPAPLKLELAQDEVQRELRIELDPALAIAGVARRTDGRGLEGVEVLAVAIGKPGLLPARARSDGDGHFRIEDLGPGTYELSADKDGFASTRVASHELVEGDGAEVVLVMQEGVEVHVRVLSAEGVPVAGAGGRLVAETGETRRFADAGRLLTSMFAGKGVSNSKGLLSLGNFGPGAYTLEVSRGSQRATQAVRLEEGPPVTLDVRLK